jgi:tetratricopeptide (TPR) repeat protein
LNRTSLVKRVTGNDDDFVEQWEVSGAISGLLRGNARMFEARTYLANSKAATENRTRVDEEEQKRKGAKPWDDHYVDPTSEETLKTFLFGIGNSIKKGWNNNVARPAVLNATLQNLENSESAYSNYSEYWVQRAYLNRQLIKNEEMNQCYKKAIELAPNNIYIQLKYARSLKTANLRSEALNIFELLIHLHQNDKDKNFEIDFTNNLYEIYFSTLLVLEQWSRIVEETVKWQDDEHLRPIKGSYRALAYQRLSEKAGPEEKDKLINSAISISDDVLSKDGYFRITCQSALRIVDEIIYLFASSPASVRNAERSPHLVDKAMSFCDKHLHEIVDTLPNNASLGAKIKSLSKIDCANNPFQSFKWLKLSTPIMADGVSPDDVPEGTLIAQVKKLPVSKNTDGSNAGFLFARAEDGTEYYVSKDLVMWKDWNKIAEGDRIGILDYEPNPSSSGNALTALKVITINW